jgi:hypothetical protein
VTHVLLDRNLDSGKEIRHRLSQWGMTMGQFDSLHPDFQWPTIQECDLVIMRTCLSNSFCADLPDENHEPLAPVILLGVSGNLLLARDAWQVLPQSNPDSQELRRAIQSCLEQVALLRHGAATGQDREDFLSFLGHEMRSPLTAAKTALEVLQGDLGGLDSQDDAGSPHLKMLAIALRNVRRLSQTVEWCQELMASSPGEQNIQLRDLAGVQLQEALGKENPGRWSESALQLMLHTDTQSLSVLMDQVVRALHYAIPDCQAELNAACSSEQQGALSLTLSPARGSVQDGAPRVSRLGLASSDLSGDCPSADLQRLVRFVISGVLVSRLGVGLEVVGSKVEDLGIRILVPGAVAATDGHQTVGQLLTPA